MPDWSRRRALHAVAAAGTLLTAGCGARPSGPPDDPPDLRERVTDIETLLARNSKGTPLVRPRTETPEETPPSEERVRMASLTKHLTSADELAELQFRTDAGAADVRSFLTATDYESRSVYLIQRPIEECYQPRLVGVYREQDGVEADFCQDLRPADSDCEVGTEDVIAVAIRLPFPGDEFTGLGLGWSGDCDHVSTIALGEGGESS